MNFEIAIVVVGFAREQRLELAARHLGFEAAQGGFGLGDDFLIFFRFAELDQHDLIVELLIDAGERAEPLLERGALLHQPARPLRIVPQIGLFGEAVQFGEADARIIDVKDASSAGRATA